MPSLPSARRTLDIAAMLTRREIAGRHRGHVLGAASALVVPSAFLVVYGLVFTRVVPVHLAAGAAPADYVFFLFAGLVGWNLVAETLGRAPALFEANAALLRKAGFPGAALAFASAATAWIYALVWLGVFALAAAATGRGAPATLWLAPLCLAIVAAFAAGAALALATLGSFARDLAEWTPPALALWLFLSPVLYPADRIERLAPWLVDANPMTPMLRALRALLIDGTVPAAGDATAALAWAAAACALGTGLHRRARTALADVVA
ncbi:MAG: ABC transporter permease [Myxococcota bacterium]